MTCTPNWPAMVTPSARPIPPSDDAAKNAASKVPVAPPTPCTAKTSSESSMPELLPDEDDRVVADEPAGEAEADAARRPDIAGGGRDGGKPGDGAGDEADQAGLAEAHPLDDHPDQRGDGGGEVRDEHGHAGAGAGRQRAAGVEAEPADPQHGRADHHHARAHAAGGSGPAFPRAGRAARRSPAPTRRRSGARRCRRRSRARRAGRASRRPRPNARRAHRRGSARGRRTSAPRRTGCARHRRRRSAPA